MPLGPIRPCAGCWLGCHPHPTTAIETFYETRRRRVFIPIQVIRLSALISILFYNQDWSTLVLAHISCHIISFILGFMVWCRKGPFADRLAFFSVAFMFAAVLPSINVMHDVQSRETILMTVIRRVVAIAICYMSQLFAFGSRSGQIFLLPVPSLLVFLGYEALHLDGSTSKTKDSGHVAHLYITSAIGLAVACWFSRMSGCQTAGNPHPASLATITPSHLGDASAPPVIIGPSQVSHAPSVFGTSDDCVATDDDFQRQILASGSECMYGKSVVFQLSGKLILEIPADEAPLLSVQQVKERVSDICSCSSEYVRLVSGECALEDISKLSELMRGCETLEITAIFESVERGPFAIGQEASWGVWENMSTNSEQLCSFDGRWELIIDKRKSLARAVPVCPGGWPPLQTLQISEGIGGRKVMLQDRYDMGLQVCADGVFLAEGRLEIHGDELHRVGTTGEKHKYKRVAEP